MVEPLKNSIVSSERKKGLSDGLKINSDDSIWQDNKAEGCGIESGLLRSVAVQLLLILLVHV